MDTHHVPHHDGRRVEDQRLITGTGKFSADWNFEGQLYAHFVRSDHAHAEIVSVDTARARAHPGVVHIFTGEDAVAAGYVKAPNALSAFPGRNGMKPHVLERPVLAHRKVRFAGEAVVMVVAESAAVAADAAELVEVQYRELPAITHGETALAAGMPQLEDSVAGNLVFESEAGDEAAVAAAIKGAAHVTRLRVLSTRVSPSPMEPRAAMVRYDAASGEYWFNVPMQGVTTIRAGLSMYSRVPEDKIILEVGDVGGGFGQRSPPYPEYVAMMLAAKATGKPVKWVSSRVEAFLTDNHGRATLIDGQLALDKDGRFLAMRFDWISDFGAYLAPGPQGHIRNTATCMTGVYRIPALYANFKVPLTNTTPVGAYRGAGRPDVAYAVERIVSQAAVELGLDGADLRRRNLIPNDAYPYKTPLGSVYEIADFPGMLAQALKFADWQGFDARRAQSAARGKLRGRGLSLVIEPTGAGNAPSDDVELVLDASGDITLYTVAKTQGQGHETTMAMIVGDALGIDRSRIKVVQCAPGTHLIGNGTGGSRSTVGAGSGSYVAAQKLIDEGKSLAALQLDVEPSQVSYARGVFRSALSSATVKLADLAREKSVTFKGGGKFGSTFPTGCHITEVEIDPETGMPDVVAYHAVDDCGAVIHHAIVEGQVHGGVVQGAGQVFGEHIVYDAQTGQSLTASFMDYVMPRAGLIRELRGEERPTASKVSPLGVKGVGESGCTASIPSLVDAVLDALRAHGVRNLESLDMPLTPAKLWQVIQQAKV
jgi:carbon-monoxide dehydrogenase large subunit